MAAIPRKARTTSLCMWRKLLGMIYSITPAVIVLRVMFTQVQHALKRVVGRHVDLAAGVQNELNTWYELFHSLFSSSTHLRKLEPFPPTWFGTTDASGSVMVGVFQDPEGQ